MKAAALLRAQAEQLRAMAAMLATQADALEDEPTKIAPEDLVPRPPSISVTTWRRIVRSGELPAKLVGRAYLARQADVDRWLASKSVQAREVPTVARVRNRAANDHHEPEGDEFDRALRRRA